MKYTLGGGWKIAITGWQLCRAVISWRLDDSSNTTVICCKCGSNEGVSKLASIWFVGTHGSCVRVLQGIIKSLCFNLIYTYWRSGRTSRASLRNRLNLHFDTPSTMNAIAIFALHYIKCRLVLFLCLALGRSIRAG